VEYFSIQTSLASPSTETVVPALETTTTFITEDIRESRVDDGILDVARNRTSSLDTAHVTEAFDSFVSSVKDTIDFLEPTSDIPTSSTSENADGKVVHSFCDCTLNETPTRPNG
jgi:hypothetical protein